MWTECTKIGCRGPAAGPGPGYSYPSANFKGSGGNITNNTWPITAYAAYLHQNYYVKFRTPLEPKNQVVQRVQDRPGAVSGSPGD